ncbi:gag/pol protein [Cucumis melo var. makuwa]|uniref:Gag/pol protein n=1 Tax=Cucumis melo var. makuwa TaxID=1194695 RepID=A0A5A7U927_CUCMM|nr:gag/pol protein [Cucumis melo var. makuwa]
MPRRSGRVVSQPNRYLGLIETQVVIPDDGVEDPLSYKQAMNDVDKDQWVKAMDLEMESMYFNSVWELVDLPEGVKPIGCKWIYKKKRDSAGKVQTFKVRLVAKGYTQREGVDYEETFSPVAMLKSIRILLSIATFYDYEIWQMDVKTSFLNGNLEESIFMSQLEGFITQGQEQKVCKLNRSIYGLKQASRSWNIRPDICYAVGIVSRYQSNPGLDHWTVVKIILKYLRRTRDYMLVYGAKDLILTGYTDSYFQTDKDSRKSTSESVFTLNGEVVVWRSINGTVANSKEPRSHKRGKHKERKYHLIPEIVQREDVIVTKIASEHNIVDPFTKTLMAKVFEGHLESLGLRDMYIR